MSTFLSLSQNGGFDQLILFFTPCFGTHLLPVPLAFRLFTPGKRASIDTRWPGIEEPHSTETMAISGSELRPNNSDSEAGHQYKPADEALSAASGTAKVPDSWSAHSVVRSCVFSSMIFTSSSESDKISIAPSVWLDFSFASKRFSFVEFRSFGAALFGRPPGSVV